jgi:hypothetical protein
MFNLTHFTTPEVCAMLRLEGLHSNLLPFSEAIKLPTISQQQQLLRCKDFHCKDGL